jgi:hypothetical protein
MPKISQKGENNGHYKHGGKGTKLYEVWCSMKSRCDDPKLSVYKYYGGKGVSVCAEWKESFISFRNWAYKNGYKEGLTIDRIDNNGNYEPSNCRWVTMKEQANNQSHTLKIEYKGETKTLTEWSEKLGINRFTLYHRIYKRGWTIDRAFTEKASFDRHHRTALKERENR